MADEPQPTAAPQSTTSPPTPQYTPRSTSIADDSETDFEPTPLHSPGGPPYEDLPPSYDFALSDARNGVASLDASQIEAHRVSANEGPDEPEVWEYRMRGESAESDESQEHEQAPAYEGHIPVQHVVNSEDIPVGRAGGLHTTPFVGSRGISTSENPSHSFPESEPNSKGPDGRGGHRNQSWSTFRAPGCGPFGPIVNGQPGRGCGFGQRDFGRRPVRGRPGRGARFGSSQDWAAFGQNMGRLGEEFGRRMGNWGEQLGHQAGVMGEQIGRQAGAMGQQIGRDAGAWATAYGGRATTGQITSIAGPSNTETRKPPHCDEPPSYQEPVGASRQETGALRNDRKAYTYLPKKIPQPPSEKPPEKMPVKQTTGDYDDDESSISSESSDSSSSSDSEDDDYDEAQAAFLRRIESINKAAEAAATKGKKSREEIEQERDLAVLKATQEKEETELKIARKQSRRMQQKELRNRRRELMREYRQKRRDLREKAQSNGKGKEKAKKAAGWKELKRGYKANMKALKCEKRDAKREWKRERRDGRRAYKEGSWAEGAE
ncbi:hypothetical protein SVAN01_09072 [Stagonosporopsis vannaccii]|nr:hypothetical protein SVAN01_09072 [Stagonosporopsis vannaccii]